MGWSLLGGGLTRGRLLYYKYWSQTYRFIYISIYYQVYLYLLGLCYFVYLFMFCYDILLCIINLSICIMPKYMFDNLVLIDITFIYIWHTNRHYVILCSLYYGIPIGTMLFCVHYILLYGKDKPSMQFYMNRLTLKKPT